MRKIIHGWMELLGPVTAAQLAKRLGLPVERVSGSLLALEAAGHLRVVVDNHTRALGVPRDRHYQVVEREVLRFVMVRLARQVGVDQLDAAAIHDDRPAAVQGDGHEVRPPPVVVDAHSHRLRLRHHGLGG